MSDSSILEFKLEIPERKLIEIKTAKKSLPVYLEKSNKKIAVDKKTKSFNLFPSPMPSASKLGDVARRLDFEDD
ncbi:hypothetical protein CEXT_377891 [Caerostris extrusa]|uniref:Uncharacterized protein n=1 Tax=Caerostris extrusa TaxID=172846 RepID=A0AAV4NMU0_CAEEX|nr:hypothetical protein CEXT_377891 [Caerostris extrusa]